MPIVKCDPLAKHTSYFQHKDVLSMVSNYVLFCILEYTVQENSVISGDLSD